MIQVLQTTRIIRLARRGRLQPWLGPAIRGLTGGRLKAITCRQSVADQLTNWVTCTGCPLQDGCAYGQTMEPDPPQGRQLHSSQNPPPRPIVFAPQYPLLEFPEAGYHFPIRILLIGPDAIAHSDDIWESLRIAGADLGLGLGEEHIPFDVLESEIPDQLVEVQLPLEPISDKSLSTVEVKLTSPLFLNRRHGDNRATVLEPTFGDLIRAGLRTLGPLHKLYGTSLPEEVFGRVKLAAELVPLRSCQLVPFEQGKWSNRSKQRFKLQGIVGRLIVGPVPEWLMPWLIWSGQLHVGTHRVAGAGGWTVTT